VHVAVATIAIIAIKIHVTRLLPGSSRQLPQGQWPVFVAGLTDCQEDAGTTQDQRNNLGHPVV